MKQWLNLFFAFPLGSSLDLWVSRQGHAVWECFESSEVAGGGGLPPNLDLLFLGIFLSLFSPDQGRLTLVMIWSLPQPPSFFSFQPALEACGLAFYTLAFLLPPNLACSPCLLSWKPRHSSLSPIFLYSCLLHRIFSLFQPHFPTNLRKGKTMVLVNYFHKWQRPGHLLGMQLPLVAV